MHVVAILLFALALAGCPRQTNETVPVARQPQRPSAARQDGASALGSDLAPPIPYLALGSQMEPVALPEAIASEHQQARRSADRSMLWAESADESHWYQSFVTPASDKTLTVYFDGLLKVRGFESAEPLESGDRSGLNLAWRSPKEPYFVEVFDSGVKSTGADPRAIYVIHIIQRAAMGAQ